MEEWRVIPDFPDYEVSNMGNVRRIGIIKYQCANGKVLMKKPNPGNLKLIITSQGRNTVSLRKNKIPFRKFVHRLVAIAFIANPNNYPMIDHINRNSLDDRVENLRWCNNSQNSHNKLQIGKSGFAGICKHANKYQSQIENNGKIYYLGRFDTAEEAHEAYVAKKKELAGEFSPF
jgi:hypothetical protein